MKVVFRMRSRAVSVFILPPIPALPLAAPPAPLKSNPPPPLNLSRQDPERVREITYGMIRKVTRTPVTVKCRIGVDDSDS